MTLEWTTQRDPFVVAAATIDGVRVLEVRRVSTLDGTRYELHAVADVGRFVARHVGDYGSARAARGAGDALVAAIVERA